MICCNKCLPRFPNFRHRSVARSNERRATPSYKISWCWESSSDRTGVSPGSQPLDDSSQSMFVRGWFGLLVSTSSCGAVTAGIKSQHLFESRKYWRQACHHDWQCQTCRPRIVANVRDSSRSWLTMLVVTFLTIVYAGGVLRSWPSSGWIMQKSWWPIGKSS